MRPFAKVRALLVPVTTLQPLILRGAQSSAVGKQPQGPSGVTLSRAGAGAACQQPWVAQAGKAPHCPVPSHPRTLPAELCLGFPPFSLNTG